MTEFKDSHMASIHELASNMHTFGLINPAEMHEFDALCCASSSEINAVKHKADAKHVTVNLPKLSRTAA